MDDTLSVVGVALVLGGLSAFFAGPLGLVVVGALALAVGLTRGPSEEPSERTNCPDCGAPNDADREACDYCGHALAAG